MKWVSKHALWLGVIACLLCACDDDSDESANDVSTTDSSAADGVASDTASDTTTNNDGMANDTSADGVEGGNCAYQDYPGTCTGAADGTFTYSGMIGGQNVEYTGNSGRMLGDGESEPCVLQYITMGTCTPCLFDEGDCGQEAFAGFPPMP